MAKGSLSDSRVPPMAETASGLDGGPPGSGKPASLGRRTSGFLVRVTHREERLRDGALSIVLRGFPAWVTPDHLTLLRTVLACVGVIMRASGAPLRPVLWVFAAAALTDFVDGPLARRRAAAGMPNSPNGGRLDQMADALLGISMGVMAVAEGVVTGVLMAAMIAPEAASAVASLIRSRSLASRPTSLARLQFVTVLSGFWVGLLGAAHGGPSLVMAGRALLYAEASIATALAVMRAAGWYPQKPA